MYAHVLVPIAIDHAATTQAALAAAHHLAGPEGKITAITVVEPIPNMVAIELPEGMLERNRAEALKALEAEAGPGVETEVVTGHAGRAINEYADSHDVDCIVIASHQPGLEDFFLGSTAARVVRHAHCAVHVVR